MHNNYFNDVDTLFKKALQKNGFDPDSKKSVDTSLARSCGVEAFSEILDLCFQCIEKELHKINVGQRLDWDLIRENSDVKPSGNFLIILKRITSELEKRKGFILILLFFFL